MTGSELLQEVGGILNFDPIASGANATQKARVVRAINQAKNMTLARLSFVNLIRSSFVTVSSQFLYTPFPSDLDQIMSIRQATNDLQLVRMDAEEFYQKVPDPTEEGTPEIWVDNVGNDAAGIKQIGLYPIPNAVITMETVYRGFLPNIDGSYVDYTTGTVAVTNGLATVTGTGTAWTTGTNARAGEYFKVNNDGTWYKIPTPASATSIVLPVTYKGVTGTGLAYTIAQRIPARNQDETPGYLICLLAKSILLQSDIQYVERSVQIRQDYEEAIQRYKISIGMELNNVNDVLKPQDYFDIFDYRRGNIRDYDPFYW